MADSRRRTADLIFRGSLAFNTSLTIFWLVTYAMGGTVFFKNYRADSGTAGRVLSGVLFFYVIWGSVWWAVKDTMLRFFVGFNADERRDAFSSRMDRSYDVSDLVARHSERHDDPMNTKKIFRIHREHRVIVGLVGIVL